jgi:dTDP-4-dehydrorhamnose 3,5-epimerase
MPFRDTEIEGLKIFEPSIIQDKRGYFCETYNAKRFSENGIDNIFVQDNQSKSFKGVLRGLHYQCGEHAQAKLVRVIQGEVQDVAVDLRKDSPTYGQYHSVILSETNHVQFLIPRGFAHGFLVLSESAVFSYKCDNFYNKKSEGGILCYDDRLNIDWKLPAHEIILSEKDQELPKFGNHRPVFE